MICDDVTSKEGTAAVDAGFRYVKIIFQDSSSEGRLLHSYVISIISNLFRFQTGTGDREKKIQTELDRAPCPLYMAIGNSSGEHFELVVQYM